MNEVNESGVVYRTDQESIGPVLVAGLATTDQLNGRNPSFRIQGYMATCTICQGNCERFYSLLAGDAREWALRHWLQDHVDVAGSPVPA